MEINTSGEVNGRLLLKKNTKLYLNAENCLKMDGGNFAKLATYNDTESADVYVNADQTFNSIYVNASIMNLYMKDDVDLTLTADVTSFVVSGDGTGELRIFNFQDETIKLSKVTDYIVSEIEKYTKLYDANGLLLGNATVINGFIALAVPEPAEWAMILGGLALGLAIYRRRK